MRNSKLTLLTLLILLSSFPSLAQDFEYNGITYTVLDADAKTCQTKAGWYDSNLSSYVPGNNCSGDITIPSVVSDGTNNYAVSAIGQFAFCNCSDLTSIILPETLTSIGSNAFDGCSSLTSINIPDSVTSIGSFAFWGCSSLTSINIPDWVTSIETSVFYGCSSLTSIILPDGVTSIGLNAFFGCTGLTSINIPEGVTSIGRYAFQKCTSLTSINIPNGIISIGESAFYDYDNDNLKDIDYNASTLIEAPENLFGPKAYKSATLKTPNASIDDVLATVPWNKFNHIIAKDGTFLAAGLDFEYDGIIYTVLDAEAKTCQTKAGYSENPGNNCIGDIVIPSFVSDGPTNYAVTAIGRWSFCNCTNLHSIILPESVTSIGEEAFRYCSTLTSINIPVSVTSIKEMTFAGCSSLTSIKIPDGVTSIGKIAFWGCSNLTSIIIPDGVTSIGERAFERCSNLTSINLSDRISSIDYGTFEDCSSLTSINIPAAVTSIGERAFRNCDNLKEVTYNASTLIEAPENVYSNTTYNMATLNTPNATLESVKSTVPWSMFKQVVASDGSIGMGLAAGEDFEYKGVIYTVIDADAMTCRTKTGQSDGQSIESVIGGNSYEGDLEIPTKAIYNNYEYTVVEIGRWGFANNTGLTSVIIPPTITNIPERAFGFCSNMTSVSIPESVTSISVYAFYQCESLKSVDLPKSLEKMGYSAFSDCSSISSVVIPESLTVLESHIFSGCSNLKTIDLPATLTQIDYNAFIRCDIYAEITYRAEVPIETIDNIFNHDTYQNGTLITPNATLEAVKSTVPWNLFKRIIASDGSTGMGLALGEQFSVDGVIYTVIDEENQLVETADGSADGKGANIFSGDLVLSSPVVYENVSYDVTEIGDYSFSGSEYLTSVTIPASVEKIGERAFSDCDRLTSIIWQGNTALQKGVIESIANPNLLVYVDSISFAPAGLDHNIVVMLSDDGNPRCENLILEKGYAFHPAIDFISDNSNLTQDFTQATIIGQSAGWETIVLPFDVKSIYSDKRGELTPFAAVSDLETQYPFWLYEADSYGEWKEAAEIKAGVPYIISMPNNPNYVERFNIDGPVRFSCSEPAWIYGKIASPYVVTWASGQEFRSLWLPLDKDQASIAMGLNVGIDDLTDNDGELLPPGSAFHVGVTPRPLEAYVTREGASKMKKIMSDPSRVLALQAPDGLEIVAADGNLILRSDADRKIDIFAIDGTHIRSLMLRAGVTETLRDLTPGLYLIAGMKVMVR